MQCKEFLARTEDWMEGQPLPGDAAHLEACAHCRAVVADLDAIRSAARLLPDPQPPERLWLSLRQQLEAEGVIRPVPPARERVWLGFLPGVPRAALAGAALAVVLVFSLTLVWRSSLVTGPAVGTGATAVAVPAGLVPAGLRGLAEMHEHNPDVVASYRTNLAIVDNCIKECEKSVRQQPGNELARGYLYDAYQKKAELLGLMAERGARGD